MRKVRLPEAKTFGPRLSRLSGRHLLSHQLPRTSEQACLEMGPFKEATELKGAVSAGPDQSDGVLIRRGIWTREGTPEVLGQRGDRVRTQ